MGECGVYGVFGGDEGGDVGRFVWEGCKVRGRGWEEAG